MTKDPYVDVFKLILGALREVQEELPWPASEHVGWRLNDLSAEIDRLVEQAAEED